MRLREILGASRHLLREAPEDQRSGDAMNEVVLILYLAGSGMTAKPVRVPFPTMQACQENAERERQRGHKARCWQRFEDRPCARCNSSGPFPLG
jgi:hypothetical protein